MSFAPSKDKSKTLPSRGKKTAGPKSYGKPTEGSKDENATLSEKEELNSKHNQSLRSGHEGNLQDRLNHIENDISVLQQQQDTYRQLMSLKDTVEALQKDQKTIHTLVKRTTKLEEKLTEFEQRFDEYQRKTEQFLVVLDKNIDEESTIREEENKKLKKVCTELERRQKEMDYEIKMDVRNTEIKAKQELLHVAADIDKKTEAHKEFLENHIDAVHRALKSSLVDDEERLTNLSQKLDQANQRFEQKIGNLEEIVMPTIDTANKRRKIDYTDLKAWLLDSIDERMKQNEKKLEDTVKKNYKSTVLQQKNEISDLKREISAMSSSSPKKGQRASNIGQSEHYINEEVDEEEKAVFGQGRSEFGLAESRRLGKYSFISIK